MKVKIGRHRETASLPPKEGQDGSYLAVETPLMEQQRRQDEQQGHSQLAKVNVVEHHEPLVSAAPEGELQNDIQQHPWLNNQSKDGIGRTENPDPRLNAIAKMNHENEKRDQEEAYRLRMGLTPKMGSAPKPEQ
ncbi:MAG: hypothetical protein H0U73_06525 [Tatlockia sp.]|nr:hypothetical protein [Tatlockia sp.]